jgi:hypothetical protein
MIPIYEPWKGDAVDMVTPFTVDESSTGNLVVFYLRQGRVLIAQRKTQQDKWPDLASGL